MAKVKDTKLKTKKRTTAPRKKKEVVAVESNVIENVVEEVVPQVEEKVTEEPITEEEAVVTEAIVEEKAEEPKEEKTSIKSENNTSALGGVRNSFGYIWNGVEIDW